ncbi:hypothetical protein [Streptomyces sp. cg35]|uniref:hypothetical protein n=1 Tax=Streptomyces sp. cg35 TaxID=3421650 RepID=UPI003D165E2A
MRTHTHWHGWRYTGAGFSDPQRRRGEASSSYPPFEIAAFLDRRPDTILWTFEEPPKAVDWLKQAGTDHPPLDEAAFPLDTRLEYAQRTLSQEVGADVIWGYYARGQTYVALALIACPRPDRICPQGLDR